MTQASKPLYSTQMLLVQKGTQHGCDVYLRELDKTIYEWVREQLPEDACASFDRTFPVDDYLHATEKSFVFENNRIFISQIVETEKLLAHGISLRRYVKSSFDDMLKDAYIETRVCIETAKDGSERGIHFSVSQSLEREPIRGFYPERDILPMMPSLVNKLLSRPDTQAEFPRLPPDPEMGAQDMPDVCYPVDGEIEVVGKGAILDFMNRLLDPLRPVCLVVLFGKGHRIHRLASRFALKLFSKACVYHVPDLPPDLRKLMADVVSGMDVDRDIKDRVCRVFFPFGHYMRDSNANPRLPLRLFRTDEIIQSVKRGCFASFKMEDIGWRTDDYDVYCSRKKLAKDRQDGQKMAEAIEAAEHDKRCEKIIAQKNAEIVSLGNDKMLLEADLAGERANLKTANEELARAQVRLSVYEQATPSGGDRTKLVLPVEMSLYPDEVREHVLRAVQSSYDNAGESTMMRRRKILKEFLARNPSKNILKARHAAVKKAFAGSNRPDEKFYRALSALGITKVSQNGHPKLSFDDVTLPIASTLSDKCHGNSNAIAQINNQYF